MSEPIAADDKPRTVALEPGGNYAWCACGRSADQPFCDGAHRGTTLRPKVFRVERAEEVHLCMCKRTKNPPYCDGSHASLRGTGGGAGG
ncbi:MAG TPA: CDGSH iron-sulfur domain-containing protein [Myxococcota bacterium]